MTIAKSQFGGMGPHIYLPDGPFILGQQPLPPFAFGTVVEGEAEAEYVYVKFAPVAAVTLNQGDVMVWDSTFMAVQSLLGSAKHPMGAHVGVAFFGGRIGDPAANIAGQGNIWSYTFQPGTYGMWVQRCGACVAHFAVVTAQADAAYTTAGASAVSALASGAANSQTIQGMYTALLTSTFTANTVSGSNVITAVSDTNRLEIGMTLSGTGVPNGTYIQDIQGATIVMSAAATATNTGTTVTWKKGTVYGTTVNGSPVITGVGNVLGLFPGATLTGTGVSQTINSITGTPGNYTITLGGNATGTGTVSLAATIYVEAMLSWPFISAQN